MILGLLAGCIDAYEPDDAVPIVPDDHPCANVVGGPWSGHPLADVTVRTSRYTHDAGIAALFDALPAQGERVEVSLAIDNAVVVNVGFEGDSDNPPIWVADGDGGSRTFGIDGLGAFRPGDGVSFTVTEITNYFGELEIVGLEGIQVVSTENAVHVQSAGAQPVSFPDDRGLNAEFAGLVLGESDDDCGDNPCLVVDNGATEQTLDLRGAWPGQLDYGETCLHVLAPVEFTRGDARIGASNFDWIQTY